MGDVTNERTRALASAWSVLKVDERRAGAHLDRVGVALVSVALLLLFVR